MQKKIIISLLVQLAFFHNVIGEPRITVTLPQESPTPRIAENVGAQTITMEIAFPASPAHKIQVVNNNINTEIVTQEDPKFSTAPTVPAARAPDFLDRSILFTMIGLLAAGTFSGAKFIVDNAPKLLSYRP